MRFLNPLVFLSRQTEKKIFACEFLLDSKKKQSRRQAIEQAETVLAQMSNVKEDYKNNYVNLRKKSKADDEL